MKNVKLFSLQLACTALVTSLGTLLTLAPHHPSQTSFSALQVGEIAIARRTGGRAGGGSFRRSSPSRSGGSFRRSQPRPNYGGGGPVFVPVPYGQPNYRASSYDSEGGFSVLLVRLILGGLVIAAFLWVLHKRRSSSGLVSGASEVDNNIFTVSKVQIALYAQARELQAELSALSLAVDTETSEGLLQLLQESALALLRHTEYWTHVSASSQVARDALEAERLANKLSIEQRRQLSAETLVNVGGSKRQTAIQAAGLEEGPAAYIVVTFLVGSAHDQPLFDKIQSVDELQHVLETLAALPTEYLMTFELIWSPQDTSDSLTDDELLTGYSDLVQL
ncbi:MAG: DUF1517 domain-containing protein [Thermosynechococcaceae cyanobacterium MS004]|nr:DUF1517 domain-containing protein [Thermosynechococcaceae cyanobacterium MS004]